MTPENSAGGFRERLDDFEERLDDVKERLDDSWKDNTEIPSGACKTKSPHILMRLCLTTLRPLIQIKALRYTGFLLHLVNSMTVFMINPY